MTKPSTGERDLRSHMANADTISRFAFCRMKKLHVFKRNIQIFTNATVHNWQSCKPRSSTRFCRRLTQPRNGFIKWPHILRFSTRYQLSSVRTY